MRIGISLLLLAAAVSSVVAAPEVSSVSMTDNGDGTATVEYGLLNPPAVITLDVLDKDGNSIGDENLVVMSGDVNRKVTGSTGKIRWTPPADLPKGSYKAKVTAWPMDDTPDYMVVDIYTEGLADRISYYTSEARLPGGLMKDISYRFTKIVMRKIRAKGIRWKMGADPAIETVSSKYKGEAQHEVELDRNYYIGVFPLTQGQYRIIMGSWNVQWFPQNPLLPRDSLFYSIYQCARGSLYPEDPASGSVLGKLRTMTGNQVDFELPTEAEWEFACRAGHGDNEFGDGSKMEMTASSYGVDKTLDELGRYAGNNKERWWVNFNDGKVNAINQTPENGLPITGTYKSNDWGLYDMLGGVREWCLDWYQEDITGLGGKVNICSTDGSKLADGKTAGGNRVLRGGAWHTDAGECRPSSRRSEGPGWRGDYNSHGMRVKCYMQLRK